MKQRIKIEWQGFCLLLRSVPATAIFLFGLAVFSMNLLANKSIALPVDWLALDCGILVSWLVFLLMDVFTKHFGAKAATRLSLLAVLVNLFFCLLLFLGSLLPGTWGEAFTEGGIDGAINAALNKTFGGTWYVVLGSTLAFTLSAVVNNFTNRLLGRLFCKNPDGFFAYATRAYLSTALAQFLDNFVFALIVSHFFFGWTVLQCTTCALTGMLVELLCEVAFSGFGYAVSKRWKKKGIGAEYLNFLREAEYENPRHGCE